jgi:hypothetical protein
MSRAKRPAGNAAPLTGKDLRAYLATQDDFAFEREIFTHAKGFGLQVQHAGLYEDQLSEKFRQFDLRAIKVNGNHRIRLAIECKSLTPSFPLLVSCVPRPSDEVYHEIICSPAATVERKTAGLYPENEPVGKAMRQVAKTEDGGFSSTDKELFDKYQQALASCADQIRQAVQEAQPRRTRDTFAAILPVLVVPDGTLWMARYSSRGSLESDPQPAAEVTFYLGRPYPIPFEPLRAFTISHLHIMTKTAVIDFLRQVGVARPGGIWQQLFE